MSDYWRDMPKPRLVFFRPKYGSTVPQFLCIHRDEHTRCLSQFFDLTVIEDDCHFPQVCERYEPDACLVEIGLQIVDARQPRLVHFSQGSLPRLALMNADAWGHTRSRILAEVEASNFDAVFSICATAAEHFPQLKDKLYYWPNFIDPNIFKDYQLKKQDLILLTGRVDNQYPWRKKVWHVLDSEFHVTQSVHAGYFGRARTSQMPVGLAYAQQIGRARFAPTCGTVAHDLIRKHLEIPAVGTCLVTERTPTLELAGFADMHNVVFASDQDVVNKLHHLCKHPEKLREITCNGHALVHERHTISARCQIADWVRLHRVATGTARLVQPNPFGPLQLERQRQGETSGTIHVMGAGQHLRLIDQALLHINSNRNDLALPLLDSCEELMPTMFDVDLLRAHTSLVGGRPEQALRLLVPMLKTSLDASDTLPPDPIEWTYLIVTLLAMGKVRAACGRAREFCEISHPHLDRARAAVFFLKRMSPPAVRQRKVSSIHRINTATVSQWMSSLCAILAKCGQVRHARHLESAPWKLARTDTEMFEAMLEASVNWQRASPAVSRRLRKWDSPLVGAAIQKRIAALICRDVS